VVTLEGLTARRDAISGAPDLLALVGQLTERNRRVIEALPPWPDVKAMLSVDGGRCPEDGATLGFDPWSPHEHACPTCGRTVSGERHHRAWTKHQHLWLAERSVELAALATLSDAPAGAAERSAEILRTYGERYLRYPNRDNVLGPSRLFFSTYLESIWVLNYVGAAALLREAGVLDEATTRAVHDVADEAANLIGEYDEGYSNRQTWNNAALCAIAVWFEDVDLARRAIQGETGLVAHLRGYRDDGMWYEGENYHLFALRGLLIGAGWAAHAGMDFSAEPELAAALTRALRAPTLTALPDFTFPARKDSRFGVSLAQPAYAELWEVGLGRLGSGERGVGGEIQELAGWLSVLYASGPGPIEPFEYYLHDAPIAPLPAPRSRRVLSWWALLEMLPELPPADHPWTTPSVFMPGQGLGVLRIGGRYVGLECGALGGGHGHPDRLNLTLFADGVYWLPDFGTGSYVTRDLFWYRSTLAHNAPRLDGRSQPPGDAQAEAFDERSGWAWMRGRFGSLCRTTVCGPEYLLDVVELAGAEERVVELPWHFAGRGDVAGGQWEAGPLQDEFVHRVERLRHLPDPLRLELTADRRSLTAHLVCPGELLRAEAPGRPNGPREPFYLMRGCGRNLRFVTVIEFAPTGSAVRAVRVRGDLVEIETPTGTDRHRYTGREWEIVGAAGRVTLASRAAPPARFDPMLNLEPPARASGVAWRVATPPALDGTLQGFERTDPLRLELEDQYRRSEESYPGAEDFAALCHAGWDDDALYLGIDVVKSDRCFRADGPSRLLDNEPDDIHSDGVQIYVSTHGPDDLEWIGYLIVPDPEGRRIRVRTVSDGSGDPAAVRGAWRETATGYGLTVAIDWPEGFVRHAGGRIGFDLLVNEMLPGRERRAGQLVWSGGNGWVWLQGDRQDPARFGILELVG